MCYSITNTTATQRCATANELCTKSKGAIKWLQRTNGVMQSSCSARGFTRTHDFGRIRLCHHSQLLDKLRCWAWSLATLFPSFSFVAEEPAREEEFAVPQRKGQQAPGFSRPLCSPSHHHAPEDKNSLQSLQTASWITLKQEGHCTAGGSPQTTTEGRITTTTRASTRGFKSGWLPAHLHFLLYLKTMQELFPATILISIFGIPQQLEVKMTWKVILTQIKGLPRWNTP